jgi:hypothetical protein
VENFIWIGLPRNLLPQKFHLSNGKTMGLVEEIKSGQYTIYAQFTALITVIVLISTGSASFTVIPIGKKPMF